MTPKVRAAMQQALDFIEKVDYPPYDDAPVIAALQEALAEQEEQEPVAYIVQRPTGVVKRLVWANNLHDYEAEGEVIEPLYAAPVRTKDLTDDELCDVIRKANVTSALELYRAVIAADREKNRE